MMKWIVILLLLVNVGYFGLQINQSLEKTTPVTTANHKVIKTSQKTLTLLSELEELPLLREELQDTKIELEDDSDPFGLDEMESFESIPGEANSVESELTDMVESDELPFDTLGTCLSIGPYYSDIEVIDLNNWLQSNNIPFRQRHEDRRTRERYWVYLAPQPEEQAKAQLQELKQKGLKDYYLIGKGDMKNAISLGLFSHQNTVNKRLAELKRVGYNPVVVPQHKITTLYWLDIQISDDQILPKLSSAIKTVNIDCKMIALLGSDQ